MTKLANSCMDAEKCVVDIDQQPVIDRYKLVEEIGRGGMGTVFMALQTEPVRRRVAVKVINPGMNTRDVLLRFEAERQTLAIMDHPSIARVFDGGKTDTGLPYFVMELVRGSSILKFCREHELPLEQRLKLFVDICSAIQHAHQKGIIHRDLKPSNILVEQHEASIIPKVIDFGIAKAIGADSENPNVTGFREVLGTPMYMSPEQAEFNALDVDTRSDVYSLGVLLYELVAHQPPFDPERIRKAGFSELFQIIREETPPLPSRSATLRKSHDTAAVSSSSAATSLLPRRVRGDLDCIVMKALEKNRLRRYQSARDLARDVHRFLNHEPIAARPPSTLYRVRKTARRHRAMIGGATIACLALLLGTAAALWQAQQAGQALKLAELRADVIAVTNQRLAGQVRTAERTRAEAEELLYATEVHLAGAALQVGDVVRTHNLLSRQTSPERIGLTESFEWQHLNQRVQQEPLWTRSLLGQIRCARVSPDGRHVAVAARDSLLRILDVNTGQSVCEHPAWAMLNSAAWSHDGHNVACACADGTVRLYSFRKTDHSEQVTESPRYGLQLVRTLQAQTSPTEADYIDDAGEANDALFTLDGRWLIAAGDDTLIRIWDRQKESLVATLDGHGRAVERLALSSNSAFLATASSDGTLRLWDIAGHFSRGDPITLSGRVVSLAVSDDGTLVAAGDINGELVILESTTGDVSRVEILDGIESLAFAPSPDRIIVGDRAGIIRSWRLTDQPGDRISEQQDDPWLAHESRVQALAVHPQTGHVISASRDGKVSSWPRIQADTYRQVDSVSVLGFAHDGDLLLGNHQLLRLSSDRFGIRTREPVSTAGWKLMAISQNSDRTVLASDSEVVVQDLRTNKRITQWKCTKDIYRVAISPDGRLVATVDYGGTSVRIRSAIDGRPVREFPVKACRCLAFSPDSQTLAFGFLDNLLLYSLDLDTAPIVFSGHSSTLRCVSFSPNGSTIATGSNDRHIRIWDAASGKGLMELPGHSDYVTSISYSRDGTRIVSAGESCRIRIWHATSMQPLLDLVVPQEVPAVYAELSPDNNRLAVLDKNDTVSIFEAIDSKQQCTRPADTSAMLDFQTGESVEFDALGDLTSGMHRSLSRGISPDGRLVVGHSFHFKGFSPFVWSETDGIRRLGPPYPDGLNGECTCVSADHSVFGGAGGVVGERGYSARLWYPDGSTRRVAEGPGMVVAISADNKIVAGYAGPKGEQKPFVERGGELRWLPLPSAENNGVTASMTPDGRFILGTTFEVAADSDGEALSAWRNAQPVLWSNGELQEMPGFGPQWNWKAVDISDDGTTIIGSCWAPGDRIHHPGARMFVWRDGALEILEPPPGFLELRPQAISGDGNTIVGRLGQALYRKNSHACSWTSHSGFMDLNAVCLTNSEVAGWTLVDALDVSADGRQVTGYGLNSDGHLEAWRLQFGQ
ncbi:protein kinase domain-containing protein [Fuerstiella marisgermanici]|uniref:protein kinase domain-containing protein n=1 Tax=Fuerstiella marisgermanici TaxID=1891926 RepID=UPI001313FB55|nr:protein kinase [Fuerstiella marisgermanici]